MPKRKGRGRPKGSSLKKVKSNANVETTVLDNAFNDLKVDPEFVEEQEKGTHGFTLSHSPVSVDPGFVEEQETGIHRFSLFYSPVNSYSLLTLFFVVTGSISYSSFLLSHAAFNVYYFQ